MLLAANGLLVAPFVWHHQRHKDLIPDFRNISSQFYALARNNTNLFLLRQNYMHHVLSMYRV